MHLQTGAWRDSRCLGLKKNEKTDQTAERWTIKIETGEPVLRKSSSSGKSLAILMSKLPANAAHTLATEDQRLRL